MAKVFADGHIRTCIVLYIYEVYTDEGISAGTTDRPALQKLFKDARQKKFDLVIVYKIDRLSRRLKDLIEIVDQLEVSGVGFKSATEPFDTTTSAGKLMFQQLGSFAEFERNRIAERVFPGMVKSVQSGNWHGSRNSPTGYTYNKKKRLLEINEREARIVRLVYKLYLEGKNTAQIAEYLNDSKREPRAGRYFIKTYGCQMNVADSAKLEAVLEQSDYTQAENQESADILLVNTCVVRQNAEDRAAWYVTSAKGLKEKNPNFKIILCGCLVSEPGRDVKKQFPHVDLFLKPNEPGKLAEFLKPLTPYSPSPLPRGKGIGDGGVTIMTGCDNFCSYCVVPYVRGREYSRPLDEVLAEIKTLVEQGVTDITLLGQNVNSYKFGLSTLLREIHSFDICHLTFVIRFLTCHPRDMSDEIIEAVAELPYVAKDFMLPLQSGDDVILQRMNRGYSLARYVDRVKKIRSLMPMATISADILVGFPGETEEQFQNTLRAIEEIKFNDVHMFAYSPRPNTAAATLPDQLSDEIKQERLQRLIKMVRNML
ncbi:tRNA (N6-isopentenyl adenosine(37)-C2)-methylthiotransferase MiaB [Candidatus Saganbacteria bacterium]|nr:tRNA (N6-isopentenyl adenosine(37)-C2)-methylthiotransferase MiaB [Candidatus Saganbacteria bacterium]